jgi:arabinofuranosyltransferase
MTVPAPARLAGIALALVFTYVYLANSWLGDDAYITFRVAWNFVNGYGLTFNPDERVQAYTHPLWLLVVSGAHLVTGEFFFTVLFVSWAFCFAAGIILVRWAGSARAAALLVAWLLTSKALVDYTASGLEYPLSYLLVVLFYARYLPMRVDAPPGPAALRTYALLASLAFVNRPDAILLFVLPLAEMAWRSTRLHGPRALGATVVGLLPAVLWCGFATLYYGFPLPNTYYAKVATGIPRTLMASQGIAYVLNSIRHDPVTLGTVAIAVAHAWQARGATIRAVAGAVLYVGYTVTVGGDFMSGRFFALPFLLSAMVAVPAVAVAGVRPAAGALVLYTLFVPLAPIKTGPNYDGAWPWRSQNGIKDERGHYHQATNVLLFSPFRELPDLVFVREGRSFRESPDPVAVHGSIGMFGLYAGPEKHVVDRNALSEPLLARLPVSPHLYFEFYASHYFRDIPEGYLESVAANRNLIADPLVRDYYDRLRNVTRGPVFRLQRLRDIWDLNGGRLRDFGAQYERYRPIALSIRAGNERFLSDVGHRDTVRDTLETTGRAGLLQYGPRIPLKAGAYRARWVGMVDAKKGDVIGFVDVRGEDGTTLTRRTVVATGRTESHRFAEADFTLDEPAVAIEYRLYVDADAALTLERVELYSAFAIPRD